MMIVYLNNQQHQIPFSQSISDTLKELAHINPAGIAIAVNNEVIPKKSWNDYLLKENDKVTIIRATQGG
jgi:sulfur carrier protein